MVVGLPVAVRVAYPSVGARGRAATYAPPQRGETQVYGCFFPLHSTRPALAFVPCADLWSCYSREE